MSAKYSTASDAIASWREDVLTGTKPPRWPLGDGFDDVELGPGLVLLLGGAPGAGKTALAMQWTLDALRIDLELRALVANVESSPRVLLDRQLARLSGIPLADIRDRRLDEQHGDRLAVAFDILDTVSDRLAFLEAPFNLENVAAAADATDSKLILLDYAQRFAADSDNKRHEVNRLMDYLRKFADAGCGMLVLAAVGRTKNRQGQSSYDPAGLNLASFRESSELEFGCDSAYMLAPDKDGGRTLACLKNRHGEPADVSLRFDGSLQRFESANIWRPEDFDVSHLWQGGDDAAE
ncbi:AAA family ATPase [Aeoliella sp. ICT_H6.2]|uniref:AAA family ATPase n=1 Tax=Aeoliella straminimaris TaxID=2954799 RepID=A0A9X2FCY5_9BACT|nr:DnaB-like helicase C-terminal domain-containing protein [Aeoliella straminimaris]MCO6045908.1 AAA family ATPase [Aeoliella straminimaris]